MFGICLGFSCPVLWFPLVAMVVWYGLFALGSFGFEYFFFCFSWVPLYTSMLCFGLFGFLGGQDLVFLGFHRFLGVVLFIFLDSWDVAAIAANNHKQHHKLTSINCRVSL